MGRRVTLDRLPRDDRTNGWFHTLPAPPPARLLDGERTADWIVVGAGYAGLGAARRIAELRPDDKVALIEAQRIGQGAAGRNSGFAIDLPHGVDMAQLPRNQAQTRLVRAALAHLEQTVRTHQIACQWSRRGKVHAAATELGERNLDDYARGLDALGEPYTLLDADATARYLGARYYTRAVHTPGCVLMQPAALVRGLARAMPANVDVFEDSPVVAVDYGATVRAETPRGSVTAPRLILCSEAFTPAFGFLADRLFPMYTFASLTRPLDAAEVKALSGEGDWGVIPATLGGTTLRYTQDRRILVRNVVKYVPDLIVGDGALARIRAHHVRSLRARFPMLPGVGFDYTWGGSLCMSKNKGTMFGRLADNVFGALCQNGVGVTKGTAAGRAIAEMAAGQDSDMVADMLLFPRPEPLPPRPLLGLGVRARLAWEEHRAGPEH
ncbi:MAG: NAD(P)/FAD-dependent oxidoreductase [Alphaproteobacteria bacterium]